MSHAKGTYQFKLTATLVDYGISVSEYFTGKVLACLPVINSSAAQAMLSDNVPITWGNDPVVADLAPLLRGFVQEPACGYTLRATPYVWYTNRYANPTWLNINQYEISVVPQLTFGIQKCALSIN